MKFLMLVTFIAILGIVSAFNNTKYEESKRALEDPDLFQGDIMGIDPHDRNVLAYKQNRWTGARVPIYLDESLHKYTDLINSAIREYHKHTCVRFVKRTTEKNYIKIYSGRGCSSYPGMIGGQQLLSLKENGCMYKGTIMHELGHALGLFHEQNRSDRDEYLRIFYCNIQEDAVDQFAKLPPSSNILVTRFDYDSIMLYSNTAFSKDGKSWTMEAKDGTPLPEANVMNLSPSDIYKINYMYGCSFDGTGVAHSVANVIS